MVTRVKICFDFLFSISYGDEDNKYHLNKLNRKNISVLYVILFFIKVKEPKRDYS